MLVCLVARGHQLKAPCNQDDYQLCDTYPAALVLPAETGHDQLRRVAAFRKRGVGTDVAWTENTPGDLQEVIVNRELAELSLRIVILN